MRLFFTRPRETVRSVARLVAAFFILSPWTQAQSEFDKAHALLKDLSQVQQQKRDEANVRRLAELMNSVPLQTQRLLSAGIVRLLNSPGAHSVSEIHAKLVSALQLDLSSEFQPEVFVFAFPIGRPTTYIIAFNIVYCVTCSRDWIGVVGREDGVFQTLASEDNGFPNQSLSVTMLQSPGQGKTRFLVHGTNWGDAHSRMSVVAYRFGGYELARIWSRVDLPQGTIKITPTEITLSFLTALVPPWNERTETYAILPEEIQLRQSSERTEP